VEIKKFVGDENTDKLYPFKFSNIVTDIEEACGSPRKEGMSEACTCVSDQ
jgi:hypothetical protein